MHYQYVQIKRIMQKGSICFLYLTALRTLWLSPLWNIFLTNHNLTWSLYMYTYSWLVWREYSLFIHLKTTAWPHLFSMSTEEILTFTSKNTALVSENQNYLQLDMLNSDLEREKSLSQGGNLWHCLVCF